MAQVAKARVAETTTTTGTGAFALGGAYVAPGESASSHRTFSSVCANNDRVEYMAVLANGEWEHGYGTYTSSGNSLARTDILEGTNGTSAVNFSAGTKTVFLMGTPVKVDPLTGAWLIPATSSANGDGPGIYATQRATNVPALIPFNNSWYFRLDGGVACMLAYSFNSGDMTVFWQLRGTDGGVTWDYANQAPNGSPNVGLYARASGWAEFTNGYGTRKGGLWAGVIAKYLCTSHEKPDGTDYTVADLDSGAPNGTRAVICDSTLAYSSANVGTAVTGGGSNMVPVIKLSGTWTIG